MPFEQKSVHGKAIEGVLSHPSQSQRSSAKFFGRKRPRHQIIAAASVAQSVAFPRNYGEAIQQAQAAVKAALSDGHTLLEIEFPAGGLSCGPGDGEGQFLMTQSLGYLRQFCRIFQDKASTTRIFFPDQKEMWFASGKGEDKDAVFGQTKFQLDYLTKPSFLHDIGLGAFDKIDPAQNVTDEDEIFIAAYPYFNVNEIVAVEEVYNSKIKGTGRPLLLWMAEVDRIRSGYLPAVFYPKLATLGKEWLPQFCSAYYLYNFKGTKPGVLFRSYPGPWQVLRREGDAMDQYRVVHESEAMPTLKEVATTILPQSK